MKRIILAMLIILSANGALAANGKYVLIIHRLGSGTATISQQEYGNAEGCKNAAIVFMSMIPDDYPVKKMYSVKCVPYES